MDSVYKDRITKKYLQCISPKTLGQRQAARAYIYMLLALALVLGWIPFDYLLEPDQFFTFLSLRIAYGLLSLSTMLIPLLYERDFPVYPYFALNFFALIGAIGTMLIISDEFFPYLFGFSTVFIGAAALLLWDARIITYAVIGVMMLLVACYPIFEPYRTTIELVGGGFFLFNVLSITWVAVYLSHQSAKLIDQYQSNLESQIDTQTMMLGLASSIAHEMRSPLGIIQLKLNRSNREDHIINDTTRMISTSTLEDTQKTIVHAHSIIDIILNNIKHGRISTDNFVELSIKNMVLNAIDSYAFKNNERNYVTISNLSDFTFLGDPVLFQYIMFNLIKNALYYRSYGPEGAFKIEITTDTQLDKNQLIVRDNGPGIGEDVIGSLFENFTSGKSDGTGLGLPFCKRAMTAFEGNISAASTLGHGAVFTLTFP